MIQNTFSLGQKQSSHLLHILMECMERRESVSRLHTLEFRVSSFAVIFAVSLVGWCGHSSCRSNGVNSSKKCLC